MPRRIETSKRNPNSRTVRLGSVGFGNARIRWLAALVVPAALTLGRWGDAAEEPRTEMPKRLFTPPVAYPENAQGDASVDLEVELDERGRPSRVLVKAGRAPFSTAARAAVLRWRFTPARRNDTPTRARIAVRVTFSSPQPVIPALGAPPAPSKPSAPPVRVTVRGSARTALGGTFIPVGEARRIPGAFGDPFRVAEVLPAVAPILSGIPYYYVRGAPPGNVAYQIDGIPVPLLFHVGAGPSVIAPALIRGVEVIPSAYPARYGRNAGGVIRGTTQPPASVARGELQTRIFDSAGMLELPLADGQASLLMGGRISHAQPLLDEVAPDYTLNYWDYQVRLGARPTTTDSVTLFAFGARDQLANRAIGRDLFDTEFHRIDLRWEHSREEEYLAIGLTASSDRVQNAEESFDDGGSQLQTRGLRLRLRVEERASARWQIRGGGDYGITDVSADRGPSTDPSNETSRLDSFGGAYVDAVFRGSGVEVVPGIRVDGARFRNRGYAFVEPRVATRMRLSSAISWVSQFSLTHQIPIDTVRIPGTTLDALELSVQRAWQTAQGIELLPLPSVRGRLTAFHSLIEPQDGQAQRARSYGLEAFVRRDFSERVGFMASYTLSRTESLEARETVPSVFDRTHLASLALGIALGRGFRAGLRGYYASGRRFRVACPTPSCAPGQPLPDTSVIATGRLDDFHRLDMRLEKRFRFDNDAWLTVALEWFNATLSKEATGISWSAERGLAADVRDPLTLPSLALEGGF